MEVKIVVLLVCVFMADMKLVESQTKSTCSGNLNYTDDAIALTGKGYAQYKVTEKKFRRVGGLSFEFRTFASNGVLFHSEDVAGTMDFITCYLQDGKVKFGFNTGSGSLFLGTDNVVNDGKWKKVTIYRNKVETELTVDGVSVTGVGRPGATVINGIKYLYFGGYKYQILNNNINAKSRVPVSACFRRMAWSNAKSFPSKPAKEQFVSKCYQEQSEKSVYFAGSGSYIVAAKGLYVGRKKIFSMEIKPRNLTGLLFAVVPRRTPTSGDFIMLELSNGSVIARSQNGDGILEAIWTPSKRQTLFDNQWHKIIVSKINMNLRLKVDDDNRVADAVGRKKTIANVKDNLFLAGVPETVQSYGFKVRSSYQGCMKNFRIENSAVAELSNPVSMFGDISMFGCPIG